MRQGTVSAAMVEFLRWLDVEPRTYTQTMDAWRTSCPRMSLWEDASIENYVELRARGGETIVTLTAQGRAILAAV